MVMVLISVIMAIEVGKVGVGVVLFTLRCIILYNGCKERCKTPIVGKWSGKNWEESMDEQLH